MVKLAQRLGVLLALGAMWSGAASAQSSGTRSSGFAYDPASGLLTQEVIEPGTPSLRLQTDYVYDAFGNKTSVTVSGVDIVTRSSTTTYDTKGEFATANTTPTCADLTIAYRQINALAGKSPLRFLGS
jgi:hypothetical protein